MERFVPICNSNLICIQSCHLLAQTQMVSPVLHSAGVLAVVYFHYNRQTSTLFYSAHSSILFSNVQE